MSGTYPIFNDPTLKPIIMATPEGCYFDSITLSYEPYDPLLNTDQMKLRFYYMNLHDIKTNSHGYMDQAERNRIGLYFSNSRTQFVYNKYKPIPVPTTMDKVIDKCYVSFVVVNLVIFSIFINVMGTIIFQVGMHFLRGKTVNKL